jgi:peptidoglycan/xylan/chitin deacetylase (PgdA/CDA1 family)
MRLVTNRYFITFFLVVVLLATCSVGYSYSQKGARHYEDQIAVLLYHHIDDQAQSGGTITTALFREQLSHLKQQGFQFITFQQFKRFMEGGEVPDNAVLVTFDDGYSSFYTNAYPVLKQLSVPAVHFIITKDLENPHHSRIPSLSKDQIMEMTGAGDFIEVQTHTNNLHNKQSEKAYLTTRLKMEGKAAEGKTEEDAAYRDRIVADIQTSVDKLKPLQINEIDALAYPFGIYHKQATELVKQAGIRYAFTVQPGILERDMDPYQIPRINAGGPWITPDMLMEKIQSQVMSFDEPLKILPLRNVMEQIGGSVQKNADNQLELYLGKEKWKLISPTEAVHSDGKKVTFSKPLKTKNKRTCIDYADFQKLYGDFAVYDANTRRFLLKSAIPGE